MCHTIGGYEELQLKIEVRSSQTGGVAAPIPHSEMKKTIDFYQVFTLRFLLTGVEEKTRFFEKNPFSEALLMQIRAFFAPPPHLPLKKRRILIQFSLCAPEWKKRNHGV